MSKIRCFTLNKEPSQWPGSKLLSNRSSAGTCLVLKSLAGTKTHSQDIAASWKKGGFLTKKQRWNHTQQFRFVTKSSVRTLRWRLFDLHLVTCQFYPSCIISWLSGALLTTEQKQQRRCLFPCPHGTQWSVLRLGMVWASARRPSWDFEYHGGLSDITLPTLTATGRLHVISKSCHLQELPFRF